MATTNALNKESQELTIDPGASGDSFVQLDINTTSEFRVGVDDTDDSFRISQGSALGTNDTFIMTAAGERTMPLHPAFSANNEVSDVDVTGDGTVYTVIFNQELFDQGSDYDTTTGIFTAPITGRYHFSCSVRTKDFDGTFTDGNIRIATSNNVFFGAQESDSLRISNSYFSQRFDVIADMDASDTVEIQIQWSGGTKTLDVFGLGSLSITWFTGFLIC